MNCVGAVTTSPSFPTEADTSVVFPDNIEEVFYLAGSEREEMGVDELNDIVITECGEYLENLIQIADCTESARRALQKDILVSVHVSASVGNDAISSRSDPAR